MRDLNEIEKINAMELLKKFYGDFPYDQANPSKGDPFFAKSIKEEFNCELYELEKEVGYRRS